MNLMEYTLYDSVMIQIMCGDDYVQWMYTRDDLLLADNHCAGRT